MGTVRVNLVARGPELTRLDETFQQVLGGDGRVLFVRGESGAGKTSLVNEFAARARAGHEDLVVAVGRCDPQSGRGDAFLPFREVLQSLTGDVPGGPGEPAPAEGTAQPHRVRALSRETVSALGPSLVGLFIPGGALLANVGILMAKKSAASRHQAGLQAGHPAAFRDTASHARDMADPEVNGAVDQDQIFEQYVRVLCRLGQDLPLLVVLEDLQWADAASLALLGRLGRRLEGSKLLVVGTYRTSEVTLGQGPDRHPLDEVAAELARQFGDITVDLDEGHDGRVFVDAFLDQEPNHLDEDFRATLHSRTGGHPLFTVELVHHLQDHGGIRWLDAQGWVPAPGLDWEKLPARVEGVIGQRLARLPEELQRALTVAAVEGEEFTAEVVALACRVEVRDLVRDLSGPLNRGHRLVSAVGIERSGNRRLSRYRFSHVTVQHYLLQHLDPVEAGFLHEDVGAALEELYGADNPEVLAALARHFHLAGVPDKALRYAELAGDRAAAAFAREDALRLYAQALEWAPDDADRVRLLTARVGVNAVAADDAAADQDITALEELVDRSTDPMTRAAVRLLRAEHDERTGDYPGAVSHAEAAADAYLVLSDTPGEARARVVLGDALVSAQSYEAAGEAFDRGMTLARLVGDRELEARSHAGLGLVADLTGHRDEGRRHFEQELAINQQDGRTFGVVGGLMHLGVNSWRSNDLTDATARLEEALALAQQIGARRAAGRTQANLGLLLSTRLRLVEARHHLEQALVLNREVGGPYAVSRTVGLLGGLHRTLGDYPAAEVAEKEGLEIDEAVGDRQDQAFRLANLGEVARATGRYAQARDYLDRALALGAEVGDRDAEVLVTMQLAALRLAEGDPAGCGDLAGQARALGAELGDPRVEAEALLLLGHAHLEGDGDLPAARESYAAVLAMDVPVAHPVARAGLAEVAARSGDPAEARLQLDQLVPQLLERDLPGVLDLPEVYARVVGVLRATGDERMTPVLDVGRTLLREQADRFTDADRRRVFLEGVRAHRELLEGAPAPVGEQVSPGTR